MKKVTKIFSYILVLVILVNNSISIFASPLLSQNPLDVNLTGKYELELRLFRQENMYGPDQPLRTRILNLRPDDKRNVIVSNMPSFVSFGDKSKDCIVHDIAKLLIQAIKAQKRAKEMSGNNQKLYNEYMCKTFPQNLKACGAGEQVADAMGVSVQTVWQSLINLMLAADTGDICKVCGLASGASGAAAGLACLPLAGPLGACIIVLSSVTLGSGLFTTGMFFDSSKVNNEKAQNAYRQLIDIFDLLLNDNCLWRDKNLFISAIDEREDVKPWHIGKRKNQENWSSFVYIKDLKCAPVVKKGSKYDQKMLNCRDFCRALIASDGKSLDIEKLSSYTYSNSSLDQIINNKGIGAFLNNSKLKPLTLAREEATDSSVVESSSSYEEESTSSVE